VAQNPMVRSVAAGRIANTIRRVDRKSPRAFGVKAKAHNVK
jgi:hypothetical protein